MEAVNVGEEAVVLEKKRSLRALLLRAILIPTIAVILILSGVLLLGTGLVWKEVTEHQRFLTGTLVRQGNQYLSETDQLMRSLAYSLVDMAPDCQAALLKQVRANDPRFAAFYLLDKAGHVLVQDSDTSALLGLDMSRERFFTHTRALGQTTFSDPFVSLSTDRVSVTGAVPILVEGQFRGMLVGELDLALLQQAIEQTDPGQGRASFVVDQHGTLIAHPRQSWVQERRNLRRLSLIQKGLASGDAFQVFYDDSQDAWLFGSVMTMASNWMVATTQPVVATAQPLIILGATSGLAFGLSFLLFLQIQVRSLYKITAPVSVLTRKADALSRGQYETLPAEQMGEFSEIASLSQSFARMVEAVQERDRFLEQRVADRTHRLQIVATLGERFNAILNPAELLSEVIDQVQENFDYYFASVLLLDDEEKSLVVRAASGDAGAEMMARGFSIPLDADRSLIARAARSGQVVHVDDVQQAADWLPHPRLPDTRSEIAVPITVEDRVIGVLDVQQDRLGTFDVSEVDLFRSLANQVGVALHNARLYTEMEQLVAERTSELAEANATLRAEIAERVRTEAALRESEERLRSLFETMAEGVVLIAPDGQIVQANPAAERILRLERSEIEARNYTSPAWETLRPDGTPMPPEEMPGPRAMVEKRLVKDVVMGFRHPDSTLSWLNVSAAPVMDQAGALAGVVGTFADITERKRAEEALQESEAQFRTLFESSPIGIGVADQQGNLLLFNDAILQAGGYSVTDIQEIGNVAALYHDPDQRKEALKRLREQGFLKDFSAQFKRKDGSQYDALLSLTPIHFKGQPCIQAIVEDITERKQAEEALQHRSRELELLNRAGRALSASLDPDQVLAIVLEETRTLLGVVACSIWVTDPETGELVCQQATGPQSEVVRDWRLAPGEGLAGWVAQNGESLIVPDVEADARHYAGVGEHIGLKVRSVLSVPLQIKGQVIGVLQVVDSTVGRFDATDLRLLEPLALSASTAIENARLHQETVRRLREAQAIGAVASDLTRSLDREQVLASIVDAATRLIPASASGVLHLVDESGDSLVPRAAQPPEATAEWRLGMSVGEGIAGLVMQEKRTINVPDVKRDPRFLVADTALHQAALLTAPLLIDEECIGTLSLNSDRTGAFSPDDERVLTTLAAQAAVAVRNARLHEQIRHHAEEMEQRVADRTRELAVLYEVAAIASQPLDLEAALARSLERALAATGGSEGLVHLLDEDEGHLRLAVQQGLPPEIVAQVASLPSDRGLGKVIARQDPLVVHDIASDPRMPVAPPVPSRAYVGVPMRAGGQPVGMLSVLGEETQLQLSVEGLSLLSSVADEVGMLVESARLRRRAERAAALEERARLARDLHDSVTQSLYSVTLFAESGRELAQGRQMKRLEGCLDELSDTALQALKEMRLLVYELRPSTLAQEGLVNALQQRLDAVEGRAGVEARLLIDGTVALSPDVEQELYHIAQEALNNALKHAKATSVAVHIRATDDRLELEVRDDGQGFDPQAADRAGGMGMSSMRERAAGLGASLAVLSAPGEGTRVRVGVRARGNS
jgi:PAS domain S-box-containing protein